MITNDKLISLYSVEMFVKINNVVFCCDSESKCPMPNAWFVQGMCARQFLVLGFQQRNTSGSWKSSLQ